MLDMNSMMGKIQEAQQKLKEAKESLVHVTAKGDAGAGLVKATVNGNRLVVNIEFDKSLLSEKDKEMLQDLTIAAINKAIENIEPKIKETMESATSGMIPNIPGMDLGNMMNF